MQKTILKPFLNCSVQKQLTFEKSQVVLHGQIGYYAMVVALAKLSVWAENALL